MKKLKQSTTKSSKTKLNAIWTDNAKISALSSGNVSKYEFFDRQKDDLPEKYLLEKAATMIRFEYSALGKELKAQTEL